MRKDGYVVVQPWMVTDYNLIILFLTRLSRPS